jgi:small subunit ribosomal protein S16
MPAKMRLQRHGKKRNAYYHIVIADNRAPRDGKFIEKIGTYNPNTNPASIDLKFERALNWLSTGAQPTETVRAILSYEGVLFKHHLDRGVLKGAFSQDEAEKRFQAWKNEKLGKIQKKIDGLEKSKSESHSARMKAEEEYNKKREQEILAKTSALAEEAQKASESASAETEVAVESEGEVAVEETANAPEVAVATEEVEAEAPVVEAATEEVVADTPAAEEAPTEETKEEGEEKTA